MYNSNNERIIVELRDDGAVYTLNGLFIGQLPRGSEIEFYNDNSFSTSFELEERDNEG
jgi:hypothetical protein